MSVSSKMNFVSVLMFITSVTAETGLWASSRNRQGKIKDVVPLKIAKVHLVTECIQMCHEIPQCFAIQHSVSYRLDFKY